MKAPSSATTPATAPTMVPASAAVVSGTVAPKNCGLIHVVFGPVSTKKGIVMMEALLGASGGRHVWRTYQPLGTLTCVQLKDSCDKEVLLVMISKTFPGRLRREAFVVELIFGIGDWSTPWFVIAIMIWSREFVNTLVFVTIESIFH